MAAGHRCNPATVVSSDDKLATYASNDLVHRIVATALYKICFMEVGTGASPRLRSSLARLWAHRAEEVGKG
jgi:hypothetical protein